MTEVIVYHQQKAGVDCPDGIAAAWIVARYLRLLGSEYVLIPDCYCPTESYRSLLDVPFAVRGQRIWLVDFSYPAHILSQVLDQGSELVVLDHHQSRMDDISQLADRVHGGYQADECGATFAWNYCFPGEPQPWFLCHVKRRDIGSDGYYDGNCLDSRAITTAMSARRKGLRGEKAFAVFDQLLEESEADVLEEGKKLLLKDDQICEAAIARFQKSPTFADIGGYPVPWLQLQPEEDRLYSWIGTLLCRAWPNIPFVCILTSESSTRHLRSLASGSNFDVGSLAKSLGGGGHRNAAGFEPVDH